MKLTRTRILLGVAAVAVAGTLSASAPAAAGPSAPAHASVYCDYANHMPSVTHR